MRPGRLALLTDGQQDKMEMLAQSLGKSILLVGRVLTESQHAPNKSEILAQLNEAMLLDDTDILFWPELQLDPLRLIQDLSRRAPRIARWPGSIQATRATYSTPGRRDYYEAKLSNAVILRPRRTSFPDEIPFFIERIP
jgi:hypothetical protein